MKKLCILPFDKKIIPLIINQPESYTVSNVVSVNKYDNGLDIAELVNRIATGKLITCDIKPSIKNSDIVVISDIEKKQKFVDGKIDNMYHEFIREGIKMAFDYKKDIICCVNLSDNEQKEYRKIAKKYGIKFEYLKLIELDNEAFLKYREVGVPIICIGEMIPECDGYEIFLKLIQRFRKDGIRAVGFSEDKYNVLYNQIPIKFWSGFDPGTTIKAINNYVNYIEKKMCPDVMLIKLPLPMTAYNNKFFFDYGSMAYIILNALKIDFLVYCGLGGYWFSEFIDNIDMNFRSKFGTQISAFHFSNQLIDETSEIEEDITKIYMPIDKVQHETRNLRLKKGYSVYNLIDSEEFELFYRKLKTEIIDLTYGII